MKKKLEADLISIAHRILKLKNKSELIQLHQETRKLYEKLSVLCFVEENFGDIKPTIGLHDIEKKIEAVFDVPDVKEDRVTEEKTVVEEPKKEEKEAAKEEIQTENNSREEVVLDEIFFKPDFEFTAVEEETKSKEITIEEVLEGVEPFPVFVRASETEQNEVSETEESTVVEEEKNIKTETPAEKHITLNDRLKKGISFGLNDRIAFQKNLFANSSEDLNRVISQLNTFDNYEEAKDFIEHLIKPDYDNWEGKEEYEIRFMQLVENKFI